MAVGTLTGHTGMVHHARCPGAIATGMTGIALSGRRDMRCWLGECVHNHITAAMTGCTIPHRQRAGSTGMTHYSRTESAVIGMAG